MQGLERRLAITALALLLVPVVPAGSALARDKVTIAALPFVSSVPVFIAQEKGYFADAGIEMFRAAHPVAFAAFASPPPLPYSCIAAEMIGAHYGLGALMLAAGNLYQTDTLLAGVMVLSILGLIVALAISRLERRLLA